MAEYYRRSGAGAAWGRLGVGLALALATVFGLGFAYAFGCQHKSYDIIGFLLPNAYGALVGGLSILCVARLGHVRRVATAAVAGAVIGFAALYFSWPPYLEYFFPGEEAYWNGYDPLALWNGVVALAELGPWTVGESDGHSPYYYWAVWAVEALILLLWPTILTSQYVSSRVYCESCARWLPPEKKLLVLAPNDPDMVKAALEDGRYEVLELLPALPKTTGPTLSLQVRLDACESCLDQNYMSVDLINVVVLNGTPQEKRSPVVKFLRIPRAAAERLRQVGARADSSTAAAPTDATNAIIAITATAADESEYPPPEDNPSPAPPPSKRHVDDDLFAPPPPPFRADGDDADKDHV